MTRVDDADTNSFGLVVAPRLSSSGTGADADGRISSRRSGLWISMRRIECICDGSLPRLAWCAVLTEGDNTVFVHHGSWVELGDSSFVEGAWSGPYIKMGFPHALTFTGSGATVTPDGVLFATPTHSVDSLYVLRVRKRLHCSNSLRHVLASADDDIDPSYMFYDVDINLYKFGIEPPPTARIPTRNRNWVTIHRCRNFIVGKDLTVSLLPKRHRGAFRDYSDYRIFLNEQVLLTIDNSADPLRSIRYIPLSTISTGYDSDSRFSYCESGRLPRIPYVPHRFGRIE